MPSSSQRYTLRDFSDELDWKPLHFVDPLPPAQVCSVCGLVVRRTGSLACGHFLCGPCYEQQRELAGPLCCPFDGEACQEGSVQWRDFPAENILEKQSFSSDTSSYSSSDEDSDYVAANQRIWQGINEPGLHGSEHSFLGQSSPEEGEGEEDSLSSESSESESSSELNQGEESSLSSPTLPPEAASAPLLAFTRHLEIRGLPNTTTLDDIFNSVTPFTPVDEIEVFQADDGVGGRVTLANPCPSRWICDCLQMAFTFAGETTVQVSACSD